MDFSRHHFTAVFYAAVVVFFLTPAFSGCGDRGSKEPSRHMQAVTTQSDNPRIQRFSQLMGERNYDSALALNDSLEKDGVFTPIVAGYHRGEIFRLTGRRDEAIECCHKIVDNPKSAEEDPYYYQQAGVSLVKMLCYQQRDYDEALQVALPILSHIDSTGVGDPKVLITMWNLVGLCYCETGQVDQAGEYYESIDRFTRSRVAAEDYNPAFIMEGIGVYDAIAIEYTNAKHWEESLTWVNREDSLLPVYIKIFGERHPARVDYYTASIALNRALAYQGLGRDAEAAKAYSAYQNTRYGSSDNGRFEGVDYLMAAHRYDEAAQCYELLDSRVFSDGRKATLEDIGGHLLPKFRANYFAGRKDSALAVATQIAAVYDTAVTLQKRNQMAELATIYDTQGKEMQIARQKAKLSQQRLLGTGIALILLTTFFVLYSLYRRRAQRRLASAHQELETAHEKLKTAYDQLEETTAAKERIESELRIARDIQMSMVPAVFPERDGLDMYAEMSPAKEVGGDLYGYVLQDNVLYFCVGDVSGKGVPASLFMAQAARLFRTLAAESLMPAEIAFRMNNALSENNERSMFVTMFIGMLHLETGHLDFCNCGHNAPVIDGKFMEMEYTNQPLGLWDGEPFDGEALDDIRGRQMLVYTDGLNEAENRQEELLGDDRLLELMANTSNLNSQEVIEYIKVAVEKHRDGADPNDDLTLMCLKLG